MADLAVVEVALDVRVTVKMEAECATPEELRRLVERDPETVRGAILLRLSSPGNGEREAGWLDEDRCAFVTEVIDAERFDVRAMPPLGSPYMDPKVTA